MDLRLPELHLSLRDEAVRFAQQEVLPHAEHIDAHEELPETLVRAAGELGLFGLMAPEEKGGADLDALALVLVVEALSAASPSLGRLLANHAGPATLALRDTSYFTEAHAEGQETIAYSHGGLAPIPDSYIVFGDEVQALGFEATRVPTMGHRGVRLGHFVFPAATLGKVANPDQVRAMDDLCMAAVALGSGRSAQTTALAYAKERRQFKRPIADFQAIQWKLADAEMALCAAETMMHRAALSPDASSCAAARLMACRGALLACDHAIQIHGGYGYTREYPVERHYRSARMCASSVDEQRQAVYAAL
ncbi:MAG: alkylation response protein AidB-like acyl-CoA dehydrogenase [Polyangiales bacterium]|jgi:alkylation response protein AidB-like acyl-CoA dehydrogenase